jgi:hypothetical protein
MGGASSRIVGLRYRRSRRLRRSRRAVVAVIGTLLALLVFFALFGIFLTQYVPLWMTENESAFSNQAATSFADLKSDIDEQYSIGGPLTYSVPFVMSSAAVPLIAQPTEAQLSFLPTNCASYFTSAGIPVAPSACIFQRAVMDVNPSAPTHIDAPFNQTATSGLLKMNLPNRYYPSVQYAFEDDTVFSTQSGSNQIVLDTSPLNVTKVGSNTTVHASFLNLYGNSSTYSGQGSKDIFSHLEFTESFSSAGRFETAKLAAVPFNFTYEVGTTNACGWYGLLRNLAVASGLTQYSSTATPLTATGYNLTTTLPTLPPATSVCVNSAGTTYDLTLTFYNISYATIAYAGVEVSFSQGGT